MCPAVFLSGLVLSTGEMNGKMSHVGNAHFILTTDDLTGHFLYSNLQ